MSSYKNFVKAYLSLSQKCSFPISFKQGNPDSQATKTKLKNSKLRQTSRLGHPIGSQVIYFLLSEITSHQICDVTHYNYYSSHLFHQTDSGHSSRSVQDSLRLHASEPAASLERNYWNHWCVINGGRCTCKLLFFYYRSLFFIPTNKQTKKKTSKFDILQIS